MNKILYLVGLAIGLQGCQSAEPTPGSTHVSDISPILQGDDFIFKYSGENGFTIATFDEDFENIQLNRGSPPKIIWLRMGNTSTAKIAERLIDNGERIKRIHRKSRSFYSSTLLI